MNSANEALDLRKLRGRAKELLIGARAGDPDSIATISAHAPNLATLKLSVCQLALARSLGFSSWMALRKKCEADALERLFELAPAGKTEQVSALLKEFPRLARTNSDHGTLLHAAVWSDSPEMARVLVGAGVPTQAMWTSSAHTALSWALTTGHTRFADALVDLGSQPDLFCAAGLGDLERVRRFWVDGQVVDKPSQTGSTRFDEQGNRLPRPPADARDQVSDALYLASRSGHLEVARWLLEHGADPNFRGYEGGTSLHWAEFSGNAELCALLRRFGGSDEERDYTFKASPRAFGMIVPAAYGMVYRLRRRLDAYPGDIDIRGGFGTALNAAVWNGQLEATQLLIARGADATLTNAGGATPLEVARFRGFSEIEGDLRGLVSATCVDERLRRGRR